MTGNLRATQELGLYTSKASLEMLGMSHVVYGWDRSCNTEVAAYSFLGTFSHRERSTQAHLPTPTSAPAIPSPHATFCLPLRAGDRHRPSYLFSTGMVRTLGLLRL